MGFEYCELLELAGFADWENSVSLASSVDCFVYSGILECWAGLEDSESSVGFADCFEYSGILECWADFEDSESLVSFEFLVGKVDSESSVNSADLETEVD